MYAQKFMKTFLRTNGRKLKEAYLKFLPLVKNTFQTHFVHVPTYYVIMFILTVGGALVNSDKTTTL